MKIDNLIRMVNRIGKFFEAMPDRPQALADIAQHIQPTFTSPVCSLYSSHSRNTPHGRDGASCHDSRSCTAGFSMNSNGDNTRCASPLQS